MGFSHALVKELLDHYLETVGYDGPKVRTFTRPTDFDRACQKQKEQPRNWSERHSLSVSLRYVPKPGTWFNTSEHDNLDEVQDTSAHEAVHHRWPGLSHGKLFDRRIQAARKGIICGPKGCKLPEEYKLNGNSGNQTGAPETS
jgi:hypothetical protein